MIDIDPTALFWNYLSAGQRGLLEEGIYLVNDLKRHPNERITDYSYLVFPFAKAYEGFLKQLFLDCGFISEHDYVSDHFRIGKALNPHLERRLRRWSAYEKVAGGAGGRKLADEMWDVWKRGRNLVFHYYPHNFKALTFPEAEQIIEEILSLMQRSVDTLRPVRKS